MRLSLILLAAGDSARFNNKTPKPYMQIGGKTLIDVSIDKIKKIKKINDIILVYNNKHKKFVKKINNKRIVLIKGGKEIGRAHV